jgi:protein-S-isoprenylcysteine O-methyltransferase Ste14/pimeloyl-ACP methyl ester carboxylesterase
LVSIRRQVADWRAAIACVRIHPALDSDRVALWGTSLSAGHVHVAAARDPGVAAVIAQVPFVDGRAVTSAVGVRHAIKCTVAATRDVFRATTGRTYRVRIFGPPGSVAAMTAPGAEAVIRATMMPPGDWDETIPARVLLSLPWYRPGRLATRITCPILYAVADHDQVLPPEAAEATAARAPGAELVHYAIDHFDIYSGAPFERAVNDQIEFLRRHLRSPSPTASRERPATSSGVRVPPPAIFGAGFAVGLLIQAVAPLPGLPPRPAFAFGAALVGAGSTLVMSSIALFRRAGTNLDPGKSTTALVTSGPYRITRNPIYAGMAAAYAGTAVWAGCTWALLVLPLVLVIVDRAVIEREERYLERVFADDYRRYKQRVRRWL